VTSPAPSAVLVVRHGATEWSRSGRHTGRTDLDLDPEGRHEVARMAPLLARRIAELGGDPVVVSSPMRRCLDTVTLALPGVEPVVIDGLREVDYGTYEGRTSTEIQAERPGWELFADGAPNGEQLAQVVARCESVIAKFERIADGRPVVAVTHGHLGRVLTCRLLGLPGSGAAALYHDTASIGVVVRRRDRFSLVGWNERATGTGS
jgi:probable phosphoglycerate mutase